ncbi:hypothetical protein E1A91_D03G059300v1 [Gossypium mustelinum]|uniref:NB-ARC domain-containing protein n=1 Tax=Gossypium mustelinum TaxID=34275 RepID=A0A5D2VKG2_GOSMU|nr:hypothetical protein E1A91_D03G059300v1 [Gossypium mustelinum]
MANSFASRIGENFISALSNITYQEISLAWGVDTVVLAAEQKQAPDNRLGVWLQDLKDAYYDAEDVVDEFMTHKIKQLNQSFHEITVLRNSLHVVNKHDGRSHDLRRDRETIFFVLTSEVIGRDEEKKIIVKMLTQDDPAEEDIPVLPIVGIRGLGKTALTKLVFNDAIVDAHFELKQWVCVFVDFDLKGLMEALQECLNGKKYLLILDNVWNEDNRKWVEFKNLLAGGASGRRIVVTTRSNRVAEITGTIPCHYFKAFPYEKSLSLFFKFAFKKGKEKQHPNLVKIGQAIMKKCQGIPLVVKVLGSLLFFKTSEQEWTLVRDSERWKLIEKDNEIVSIMKLSCDQLSPQLKQCFAYCSFYPNDYCFNEFNLIAFWMAHGLLKSPSKNENPYDIGMKILPLGFDICGLLTSTKIPLNSLIDLAICIHSGFPISTNPSLKHFTLQVLPKWIGYLKHLRFLDLSNCPNIKKLPNSPCELYKLQTLNFHGCGQIEELPKYMRYMVNLNFLSLTTQQQDLGGNGLQHLKSLQLLVIYGCPNLKYLFQEIQELTSLNTLVIAACKNLVSLPLGLENLTALQYLIITDCEQLDLSRTQGFQEKIEKVEEDGFSLLSLGIVNLPKPGALPQWLLRGSANTLKNLTIADCVNLTTSVEWHNLTSLEKLAIIHCPQLLSLPNNMQRLKQLKI